jgi:hypothetical protein
MQPAVSLGTGNAFRVVWRAGPDPLAYAPGGLGWVLVAVGKKGRNVLGHSLNWGVTAVCEHLSFFIFFITIGIPLWRVNTPWAYQIWWGGESLPIWLVGF